MAAAIPGFDQETYRREHAQYRLRSAEEALYHKLLREQYPDGDVVMDNVARRTDREVEPAEMMPAD